MRLLVYVRHPDETSLLIDELTELEEAIALCHDLVAVDGYERAEVWSEEGDRLHTVERDGATLRTLDSPVAAPTLRVEAPLGEEPLAGGGPADDPPSRPADVRDGGVEDGPREARPEEPRPRLLGELPEHPERWLGL